MNGEAGRVDECVCELTADDWSGGADSSEERVKRPFSANVTTLQSEHSGVVCVLQAADNLFIHLFSV